MLLRFHRLSFASTLVAASTLLLNGCAKATPPASPPAPARVTVVSAESGSVTPVVTLGGIIVPFANVAIQSNLTEAATSVDVQEGDRVHVGQVLAVLDTRDLRANLTSALGTAASDRAKATQTYDQANLTIVQNANSVASGEAAVRQAQANLARDTLDLERYATLLAGGYVSQQQYDQANATVINDRAALRTQSVTLANLQTQVRSNGTTSSGLQGAGVAAARADEQTALGAADQIRTQIAKATIVSPIDGVVVNRNINPGEYPGTRQLFTLQQTDRVYAVLNGSGADVIGVGRGARATIASSDRPNLSATGTVVGVLDEVTPGTTNFVVKVLVSNPRGLFHAGMVVSASVAHPRTRGIEIPETAFLDDTHATVQAVRNGNVETLRVSRIAGDGKHAVVRGLSAGTQIIVNGQLGLPDGATVAPERRVAER